MKFNLDNGYLAYSHSGQGIPLLFIHGYPLSRKMWEPQVASLSDIASILAIDLRGHGESFPFEPPYPMELLAEDCKSLLDKLDITGPLVICGLSMGGYVTLALYRKYPQLFKGMILTSTRSSSDSPAGKAGRDDTVQNVQSKGVPFIVDGMLPKAVSPKTLSSNPALMSSLRSLMLATSVQAVIGDSLGMRDRLDSTPLLPHIDFPVLIIRGADDVLIPQQEVQAMHDQIPGSRLVVIPDAGHLVNMEKPGIFNREVRDFLNSLG